MVIRQPTRARESDDWSEFYGVPMAVEEFLELDDSEETDLEYADGLVEGKSVVDRTHGNLVGELCGHFWIYARPRGAEFGPERRVRLGPRHYRKPDMALWVAGTPTGNDTLPTLAVEVRSRDDTMASQRRKCRVYREAGIPVVWLIDPISRTVEVFEGGADGERIPPGGVMESAHLPGFRLAVADLFAVLDSAP